MLERTTVADAKMRTTRRYAIGRRLQDFIDDGFVVVTVPAAEVKPHPLAGQGTGYEHGLAVDSGHAAAVVGQIGYIGFHYSHVRRVARLIGESIK